MIKQTRQADADTKSETEVTTMALRRSADRLMRCSLRITWSAISLALLLASAPSMAADGPSPLLKKGDAVDWWFVFKFNGAAFPGCAGDANRVCPFGGEIMKHRVSGQQYVYASSENEKLQKEATAQATL